ncbi:MAG: hypothetical protein Q8N30_08020 [Methylococcales bacterium]|nr:hypothetical protein [Methylococcales bacterium]
MPKVIDNLGRITIEESDMQFGSYSRDDVFYIEASKIYKNMRQDGVQTAEFLLFKIKSNHPVVLIVEAKKSAPKILNKIRIDKLIKNEKEKVLQLEVNTADFFDDIKSKFKDTLSLFVAIRSNLHDKTDMELPENFRRFQLSEMRFRFILVIKKHELKWLPELQSKVEKELNSMLKIWNLSPISVEVLNEERAKKRGLIANNDLINPSE